MNLQEPDAASNNLSRQRSPAEWGLTKPVYRRLDAFKMIGVGPTKGHELIKGGKLEVCMIGSSTNITAASIASVLNEGLLASAAA